MTQAQMEDLDQIMAQRLAKTRDLFLKVLAERDREIVEARRKVEQDEAPIDLGMAEIRSVYHRIAGSAGSLGFAEFGDLASTFEATIDSLREARRTDDTGWAAVVRDSEIFRARIAEILERR